jgi:hypothetical protein
MTGATGNIYSGLHEFEDMGFLLHFLRPDDLFVDIGANIGSYTILASAAIGAATIAFEPVPDTHEWLRLNVAINNVDNKVERRREALGWGDDYELLFTLPAGQAPPVPASCIGKALPPGPAPLLLDGRAPSGVLGYEHG